MTVASPSFARMYVDGRWVEGRDGRTGEVRSPWHGALVGQYAIAAPADVDAAVTAAVAAFERPLTPTRRWEILEAAARLIDERSETLATLVVAEAGKPIRDARVEVDRAAQTVRLCAEESKRLAGEVLPFDGVRGQEHRVGLTLLVPIGVVVAITPFNAPISQLTHKVPAAIAAGCPVVFKPSELTPGCAAAMVAILEEAGLEPGWVNLVHGDATVGLQLVEDPRVAGVSFTGSFAAGRAVRAAAGLPPTVLELGGSSPNIVHADADLDLAAGAIAKSGFTYAGQLCTSAQRILVHEWVRAAFVERLLTCVGALVAGDPAAETTDVHPTVLLRPSPRDPVVYHEAFAPLVCVLAYRDLQEAIALANDTPYGLSAGVFTDSIDVAFVLGRGVEAGTVNVNDASSSRIDRAPFAGVKNSGCGREGIPYALQSFVHERLIAFALRDPPGAAGRA